MRTGRVVPTLALVLAAGCAGGESPSRAETALPPAEDAAATAEASRDLANVDVCALIPADAVATALGGAVAAEPTGWDPGWEGKGCRYKTRAGSFSIYTEVGLVPPDDYEFLRQAAQVPTHDVSGLGDGAWWMDRTDRADLYVLRRGDVMVWIRSQIWDEKNTERELRAIAEAVLARL